MSITAASFRVAKILFMVAMSVTYAGLVAGIAGLLDGEFASLTALGASIVGALAALAFSVLWNREWRRTHQPLALRRG
jgi:hypothetical protein